MYCRRMLNSYGKQMRTGSVPRDTSIRLLEHLQMIGECTCSVNYSLDYIELIYSQIILVSNFGRVLTHSLLLSDCSYVWASYARFLWDE